MDLLVSTSIVSAFIAGVAALFAPCCITVLLPAYLGSIFRERRTVFLMTFIFFLGILTVFLPLGLGMAALSSLFSRYHGAIFTVGGLFLAGLGVMLLLGKRFTLPWKVNPALKSHHPLSVFVLGIFSGIATTCCAPVLAGVLALAALPGSVFWGAIYTLAYVLGMVAPLFIVSLLLDRTKATQRLMQGRKTLTYSLAGKVISLTLADLMAGIVFLIMGTVTVGFALSERLMVHSDLQVTINIWMTQFLSAIRGGIDRLSEPVWGLIALVLFGALVLRAITLIKREQHSYEKTPHD